MDFVEMMFMAFGVVLLLVGIASVVTRKLYMSGLNADKYTEESLRKYAPVWGIINIIGGIGIIAFQLLKYKTAFAVGSFSFSIGLLTLTAAFVVLIAVYTGTQSMLVKK